MLKLLRKILRMRQFRLSKLRILVQFLHKKSKVFQIMEPKPERGRLWMLKLRRMAKKLIINSILCLHVSEQVFIL